MKLIKMKDSNRFITMEAFALLAVDLLSYGKPFNLDYAIEVYDKTDGSGYITNCTYHKKEKHITYTMPVVKLDKRLLTKEIVLIATSHNKNVAVVKFTKFLDSKKDDKGKLIIPTLVELKIEAVINLTGCSLKCLYSVKDAKYTRSVDFNRSVKVEQDLKDLGREKSIQALDSLSDNLTHEQVVELVSKLLKTEK